MPLLQVRRNFQITIPAKLRQALGIKVGDYIDAELQDEAIVLKPQEITDRSLPKRKEESKRIFSELVDRIRERNKDVDPTEVEALINEAVTAVRAQENPLKTKGYALC